VAGGGVGGRQAGLEEAELWRTEVAEAGEEPEE
jgi:hypothetical protein